MELLKDNKVPVIRRRRARKQDYAQNFNFTINKDGKLVERRKRGKLTVNPNQTSPSIPSSPQQYPPPDSSIQYCPILPKYALPLLPSHDVTFQNINNDNYHLFQNDERDYNKRKKSLECTFSNDNNNVNNKSKERKYFSDDEVHKKTLFDTEEWKNSSYKMDINFLIHHNGVTAQQNDQTSLDKLISTITPNDTRSCGTELFKIQMANLVDH